MLLLSYNLLLKEKHFQSEKSRTGEVYGFGDNKFKQLDSTDTKNFKIPSILPLR